jgi:hypothetical protein
MRVGAVVLAVALAGSYVRFRADQARRQREIATAEAATVRPGGLPTTQRVVNLMPSSKSGMTAQPTQPTSSFSDLSRNLQYTYQNPYPATNPSAGFKLNNSISAEFAVGSDICGGTVDLTDQDVHLTEPTTAPTSDDRIWQP